MDLPFNFSLETHTNNESIPPEGLSVNATTDPVLDGFNTDTMSFFHDLNATSTPTTESIQKSDLDETANTSFDSGSRLHTPKSFGGLDIVNSLDPALNTDLQPSAHMSANLLDEGTLWQDQAINPLAEVFQWDYVSEPTPQVTQDVESLVHLAPFEFDQTWLSSAESLLPPKLTDHTSTNILEVPANTQALVDVRIPVDAELPPGNAVSSITKTPALNFEPLAYNNFDMASSEALVPAQNSSANLQHIGHNSSLDPQSLWQWLTPANTSATNQHAPAQITTYEYQASSSPPAKKKTPQENYNRANEKIERRKAKPIASRFQKFGSVSVMPSYVQCLNVVLDYHGYTGTIRQIILNDAITNIAVQAHDVKEQERMIVKRLDEGYTLTKQESLFGKIPGAPPGDNRSLSVISGILQRKVHVRDIPAIVNSVSSMAYVKSGRFNINSPYEPQYYRYELDEKGRVVNESKCGMCAFCPLVKFLPFKNSSYLSHMTLEHGIFASNYVVPEGLYYGRYRMFRSNDPLKTRTVKALQCPACFQVIEVACWKNKSNPLLSYFRHFKKIHSNLNKTFTLSTVDPVSLKHQCGDMFPEK